MQSDTKYIYNVSVDDGKYTFRLDNTGYLDVLRYGAAWWVPREGSKAIISLMDGEERRQEALARVNEALTQTCVDGDVRRLLEGLRDILGE